jgi:hypothetical protein
MCKNGMLQLVATGEVKLSESTNWMLKREVAFLYSKSDPWGYLSTLYLLVLYIYVSEVSDLIPSSFCFSHFVDKWVFS